MDLKANEKIVMLLEERIGYILSLDESGMRYLGGGVGQMVQIKFEVGMRDFSYLELLVSRHDISSDTRGLLAWKKRKESKCLETLF